MIEKNYLIKKYLSEGKSVHDIATELGCSDNKITYWLQKYGISRCNISEAVYLKNNPNGDPFDFQKPHCSEEWFLYGLGLGLFWGEGNKANKNAVRLGNTDPDLVVKFLEFLNKIYNIDNNKLSYGLQIFSDVSEKEALNFWKNKLRAKLSQFQKVVITKSTKKGTYKNKNRYGVLTVYFSNTKLRNVIVSAIDELRR